MNIIDALDDVNVFGGHFRGPTWDAWRVFLAALFALPMTEEQLALYRKHTGRSAPPAVPSHEAWLAIGRRGGKSFALATVAVFLACFKDWRSYLGPGEVATIMIVARDRRQARVIKRFVSGLLRAVPMLAATIEDEQVESITLSAGNGADAFVAEDREQARDDGTAVRCPEPQKWLASELAVEQRAYPGTGEPERMAAGRVEREDEGIAQGAADGARLDLRALWRRASAAPLFPIGNRARGLPRVS
jgi:hypothetical protein